MRKAKPKKRVILPDPVFNDQILDVEATFAVEPSEEQKQKLIDKLTKKTGKNINLTVKVDRSILGGGIIKIGDQVTDGSIRKELNALKRK